MVATGGRCRAAPGAPHLWRSCPLVLVLALLCTRCASQSAPSPLSPYAGIDFTPPNPLIVCIAAYPPFILDSSYNTGVVVGNDTYPAPVPYGLLKGLTPTHELLMSNDTRLAGVDYEYTRLVFETMLQVPNLMYLPMPNFLEMYIALRNESCQVAVTAAEMDPSRTLCTSACPGPPFIESGDYANGGYSPATLADECCLEYGAPYLSEGFALLSLLKTAPFDVSAALFNADVGNAVLVILLMALSCGFIMFMIERDNPHLGSFSRASYWSLMTFFLLADQTPRTKRGRFLQVVWLATNLVSMSVITSIIAAKLTTSSLVVIKIETLADVTSGLCQETGYPVAQSFVQRSPNKPTTIVYAVIDECVALMLNGTVQAVLSDAPILNWFVSNYGLADTYVSGILYSNPFSFVYSSLNNVSDSLRLYTNPAVIGTLTDDDFIHKFQNIKGKYISVGASAAPASTTQPINPLFFKPCIALIVISFANAFLNGELGPGLPERWKVTATLKRWLSAPPDDENEQADADKQEAAKDQLLEIAPHMAPSPRASTYSNGNGHHHMNNGGGAPSEKHVELLVTLLAPLLAELREVKGDVQRLKEGLLHTSSGGGGARKIPPANRSVRSDDDATVEFEGNILQDVRAGQQGFATRLKVQPGHLGHTDGGAQEGDLVTVTYTAAVIADDGGADTQLQEPDEPLTFEVGAADAVGNPLFQAFDKAVRGLRVGETSTVQAQGGEYDNSLLFAVPRDHQEVARLQAELASAGGLREGMVVQLVNGQAAVVRRVDDTAVLLDCNHPLAGAPLTFTITLLELERGTGA